jgi:hypothetical protein
MDINVDMMMHAFLKVEAHDVVDEEEWLEILDYLLQLQAVDLNNAGPSLGGSKFGRRKRKEMRQMEGHAMLYADHILYPRGISTSV